LADSVILIDRPRRVTVADIPLSLKLFKNRLKNSGSSDGTAIVKGTMAPPACAAFENEKGK